MKVDQAAETPREMMEMRYLWRRPVRMDNSKLVARLGEEAHTPLDTAVAATLETLITADRQRAARACSRSPTR